MDSKLLAVFIPSLGGGGAERVMLNLAGGFADRGHDVDLVVADATGALSQSIPRGVRLVDLQTQRLLRTLPALVRYLRRNRPDAMLSALNYANVVAVVARWMGSSSTRLLISERSTLSRVEGAELTVLGKIALRLVSHFYSFADCIVAPSEGVASDLVRHCRVRSHVISNPVIDDQFVTRSRVQLDHAWLADNEVPVYVSVGRLTVVKDHHTLIHAFRIVRERQPARLIILGEGPLRPNLEELVHELRLSEDVELPGFVENPLTYMRGADVFVLSSRREGLPSALVEALALGTRVVATHCDSGPEEILEGGRYGKLVPVGDAVALASAMHDALSSPAPQPGAAWRSRYSRDSVVTQYLEQLLVKA